MTLMLEIGVYSDSFLIEDLSFGHRFGINQCG